MPRPFFLCPHCRTTPLFHALHHDAWWCARCDRWAEDLCGDPDCSECKTRPLRPSELRRKLVWPPLIRRVG